MKTKLLAMMVGLTVLLTACGQSVSIDQTGGAAKEETAAAGASEQAAPAETTVTEGTAEEASVTAGTAEEAAVTDGTAEEVTAATGAAEEATVTDGAAEAIGQKTWPGNIVEHENFRDLGNYVIEMPDYTDPAVEAKGIAEINRKFELGQISLGGCSCMMTTNSKGEVIAGRNMDIEISQYPAYLFRTTYSKYKTIGISYLPGQYIPYEELQKAEKIDDAWY
nr:hypothetical protein [Lachnospiraceae bacterium]